MLPPHISATRDKVWGRYRSAVDGDQQSQLLEFSTDTKEANEMVSVCGVWMVSVVCGWRVWCVDGD